MVSSSENNLTQVIYGTTIQINNVTTEFKQFLQSYTVTDKEGVEVVKASIDLYISEKPKKKA